MNIRDLEYFVAVAEHRHFGKAAREVCVSQPTLSMQLKKLEDSLGAPLFERSRREVFITPFGSQVLRHAKEILHQAHIIAECGKLATNPSFGEMHIGIFPTLAPYFLPKLVSLLKKNFSELKLFFHEEKTELLMEKLVAGEIDAAFMALPVTNPKVETVLLFEEEFLLAVPTDHEFAKLKSISVKKLKAQNLLLLEDGHCFREQALAVCDFADAQANTDFSATSIETLLSMVAAGSGITLVPRMAAVGKGKEVTFIPFKSSIPRRSIALVFRNSSYRRQLFMRIGEGIRERFG